MSCGAELDEGGAVRSTKRGGGVLDEGLGLEEKARGALVDGGGDLDDAWDLRKTRLHGTL